MASSAGPGTPFENRASPAVTSGPEHEPAQHMSRTAQSRIGIAHLLALAISAGATAQAIVLPAAVADIDGLARECLEARDPMTRGEAALWLAAAGRNDAYRAILVVARDPIPAARQRGILAVGHLATPGAEAFLSAVLNDAATSEADAAIAAYGLGHQPASVPNPSVDAWLGDARGRGYKRLRDPLAAMLAALATSPHPEKLIAVRSLRSDEANREDTLLVLAGRALAAAGEPLAPTQAWRELADRSALVRAEAVRALAGHTPFERANLDLLRRLARADANGSVRAGAIRLLAEAFDESALELARRALASHDHEEALAGAEVLLRLTGSVGRDAVEARIATPTTPSPVRAGLLAIWDAPLTPRLTFACQDAARSANAPMELRVAAAVELARSDVRSHGDLLASLFETATTRDLLCRLAAAMTEPQLGALQRLLTMPSALRTPTFAARLHALASTSLDRATAVVLEHARARRLDERHRGLALAALRTARTPECSAEVRALLPEPLASLLY